MDDYLDVLRSIVVNALDLDFPLVVCRDNRFNEGAGRGSVGNFADNERLGILDFDFGANLYASAACPVVIVGNVDGSACEKVRVERELFPLEVGDARFAEFVEVVRKDVRRKPDGDAIDALGEEKRELGGKRERLLARSVVVRDPLGRLFVEENFLGELGKPAFDVTARCRAVAGERVSPVSLGIDEQVLLAEADKSRVDGRVSVRMVPHRCADDVRDLVQFSVVHFGKRMQNAPLHGLQAVFEIGNRPVENHVARIVQEPAVVKLFEMVRIGKSENRRVALDFGFGRVCESILSVFLDFVAHLKFLYRFGTQVLHDPVLAFGSVLSHVVAEHLV